VWAGFLADLGIIAISPADLVLIGRVAASGTNAPEVTA
jgi:hypothetical protein